MKYGIIDIGTNSVRLLLAEKRNNKLYNTEKHVNTTRLGSFIGNDNNISIEGMNIILNALKMFKEKLELYGCDEIRCIGTAALRNASNSDVFISMAKKDVDIDVEIISGDREAFLGYKGVIGGVDIDDNIVMIIDIGGGSTEFIIGDKYEIFYKKSLDIGALLLTEKYITSMPEDKTEIDKLYSYIDGQVLSLYEDVKKIIRDRTELSNIKFIGIGGTITQASAINQGLNVYSREKVHLSKVSRGDIEKQIDEISKLTLSEREDVIGLHPKRAGIIVSGELILKSIMQNFGFDHIVVSEYDNLEGLIL